MLSGPFKRQPFCWQRHGEKYDGGEQDGLEGCCWKTCVCVRVYWEEQTRELTASGESVTHKGVFCGFYLPPTASHACKYGLFFSSGVTFTVYLHGSWMSLLEYLPLWVFHSLYQSCHSQSVLFAFTGLCFSPPTKRISITLYLNKHLTKSQTMFSLAAFICKHTPCYTSWRAVWGWLFWLWHFNR